MLLRQNRDRDTTSNIRTTEALQREQDIKALEVNTNKIYIIYEETIYKSLQKESVRGKSTCIAKLQGQLADLGSVIEKRRFSSVADIRETKVLGDLLVLRYSS